MICNSVISPFSKFLYYIVLIILEALKIYGVITLICKKDVK